MMIWKTSVNTHHISNTSEKESVLDTLLTSALEDLFNKCQCFGHKGLLQDIKRRWEVCVGITLFTMPSTQRSASASANMSKHKNSRHSRKMSTASCTTSLCEHIKHDPVCWHDDPVVRFIHWFNGSSSLGLTNDGHLPSCLNVADLRGGGSHVVHLNFLQLCCSLISSLTAPQMPPHPLQSFFSLSYVSR